IHTVAHHHYIDVLAHSALRTIGSYAKFAYTLPPGHVFQNKLTDVTGYYELSATQSAIDSTVQQFLNPDVGASATQTAVALGRKLHKKFTLPPSHVTLTVLNGNGVVGSAFHGQLAPVVIPPTPVRHPPEVRSDPGLTQSTLAGLKKRMPFRLQLPAVVERSSYLDTCCGDTPVRVYRLGGTPTVRLTF